MNLPNPVAFSVSLRPVIARFLTLFAYPDQARKGVPLAVKTGSTVVKIYRDRKRSGNYFRLVHYLGGKRHRLNFRSLDDAKKEAAAKAAQLARGDVDAVQLAGRDRLTYGRALDAIQATGAALDAAATEYAQKESAHVCPPPQRWIVARSARHPRRSSRLSGFQLGRVFDPRAKVGVVGLWSPGRRTAWRPGREGR